MLGHHKTRTDRSANCLGSVNIVNDHSRKITHRNPREDLQVKTLHELSVSVAESTRQT